MLGKHYDVNNNVAYTRKKYNIFTPEMSFQCNLYIIWRIESNIRASVLLNLLNFLKKKIMLSKPRILSLSATPEKNSAKHEHSCKILYA